MLSAMATESPTTPGYAATREQLLQRLNRVEGQVRGVSRMVEEERYCIDILTQISAIRAALDRVALGVLDEHVRHCVVGDHGPGTQEERVDELMAAVGRLAGRRA
jgi:DNA-binding FrmR family transcriptional regulator